MQNILGLVTAYSILLLFLRNDGSCKYLKNLARTRKISQVAKTNVLHDEISKAFKNDAKNFVTVTDQKIKDPRYPWSFLIDFFLVVDANISTL